MIWQWILTNVVPVLAGAGVGFLLGGRRRAVADAADTATDEATNALLEKVRGGTPEHTPKTDPFNDEPTRPH